MISSTTSTAFCIPRTTGTGYANNLMKELPRIPRVATYEQFMAFVEAGQELARLHVHFEDVELYTGVKIEFTKIGQPVLPRDADEMGQDQGEDR